MRRTTSALLWGGIALVPSSFALQRLAAVVRDGSIPSLRGEAKYRRHLKFVLGLGVLSICLLVGAGFNADRAPDEQIRPFNFCLSAHVAPFGHPEGVDPLRFHLIAPYAVDPKTYLALDWVNRFSGVPYAVTMIDDSGRSGAALLQTYGTVFSRYAGHLEAKSLDSAGRPGRGSGLLVRRPVQEGSRAYVGKESNRIEEVETGLLHRLDEVMKAYGEARDPWHSWVVPVLQGMTLRELVERTGLDRRTIQRLRNRHSEPRPSTEGALTRVAGD